jgi:outer membrane protein assembly factor BamE (lipoprotein component of BamABCDE complex)
MRLSTRMVLAFTIFTFGCAIKVGKPFDTGYVEKIQPGSTAQAQVLELLGNPNSEGLKDGKPLWTYLFVKVPVWGGTAKGTVLTIEFDRQGIVQSYSYIPY